MNRTRWSFAYLVGYLALGGAGLLAAPELALRALGATATYSPDMSRLVGALMLGLAMLVGQIARLRVEALYPTTLAVRILVLTVLLLVHLASGDRLFLVLAGIVGLGMLLTSAGLLADRRAGARAP